MSVGVRAFHRFCSLRLTILDQGNRCSIDEMRLRRCRTFSEDEVRVWMRCAIHAALVCRGGHWTAYVIAGHHGHLCVGRLVAARDEAHRLGLVERDGEADAAEHFLGDLLRRLHVLPVRRFQAVCLVEHVVSLLVDSASIFLQILLEMGLLLAERVVLALILLIDTGHGLHGDAVGAHHADPLDRVAVAGELRLAELVLRLGFRVLTTWQVELAWAADSNLRRLLEAILRAVLTLGYVRHAWHLLVIISLRRSSCMLLRSWLLG